MMETICGFVTFDIREGQEDAFTEAASACHEAILPNIAGTQYYEWFTSEDRRKAFVIEIYDDLEAFALHARMLNGRHLDLHKSANLHVTFAGGVPKSVQEKTRRLGEVEYVGPRAFGLINAPAPNRAPLAGDERVYALTWYHPQNGKSDEFRRLAQQCFEQARDHGDGVLACEWFFSPEGPCLALQMHRDADAMSVHSKNSAPITTRLQTLARSRAMLFGALPPLLDRQAEASVIRFPRRLHGIG